MKIRRSNSLLWLVAAGVWLLDSGWRAQANPTGMTVQRGSASLSASGSRLTVTTSQNASLNWQSFNIGAGETTIFNQPSAWSLVVNRITDQNPSQIYGSLQANGFVVLMNASGFYFGPNAFIKTGGLIVSTANCLPPQNGGGSWQFNGPPPLASIVNYGQIQVGNGGSAFLIADQVENHGTISAPGGTVGLASGQTVLLSDRPDGRGMSMTVTLPQGSVNNYGTIVADGGTIAMNAQVVNQNGLLQANSVRNVHGTIELVASDQLNLGANSRIAARGNDSTAGSSGGTVTLQSGNDFSDDVGSRIDVSGGAQGGNGGRVEISAPNILSLNSSVDASAQAGWNAGTFALDPINIMLGYSGATGPDSSGTIDGNGSGPGTLNVNVNTAFQNLTVGQILLEASGNITLNTGTTWDLSASTSQSSGLLTLEAGGNIIFSSGSLLKDANNWSVNLEAGVSFPSGTVQSGVGSILVNSGAIQTAQGSLNLEAGNNITVGSGYVRTDGGGSITATALAGSVNTGTAAFGYQFNPAETLSDPLYTVSSQLGGISTANGGNVTINAGLDVISYLPSGTKVSGDAGSGAFGSAPGNVTIIAGRNVTGHYVVANGTGTIKAGNNAGTGSAQLALSLISGGWNVNAAQNIILQEVRNPNGTLNYFAGAVLPSNNYFDYAPDDYVNLTAGNSVTLTGGGVPRNSGSFESGIPSIYPGILNIVAGAGGVTLAKNVILFPSPQGSLNITTTGDGPLESQSYANYLQALANYNPASGNPPPLPPSDLIQFVMSDSSSAQYLSSSSFGYSDHASVPVHLNSPTPVTLNISGSMDNILLAVPEAAQINVGGDMNNSRFIGQNLNAGDVTGINVAGDIVNRNDFTAVPLATTPDLALLAQALDPSLRSILSLLHYDPTAHTLTFQGRMTSQQFAALESLTIQLVDANGVPEVDVLGNPITAVVSILDPATANALFQASQNIPSVNSPYGYVVGGGGTFNVNARNLDLGTTLGIQSVGPLNNPVLANYFLQGANINVNVTGNLDMFSTTISSPNGGDINVNAGGDINVGSTAFAGNDQQARGIFTVAKSDVTVVAGGDINLNGSRIAAYDGGNVTVESLHGNVNAGNGANGYVGVEEVYVDPVTRKIYTTTESIPGSGILATTLLPPLPGSTYPAPQNAVGNILVETPEGDILAGLGGVTQLPLNGSDSADATVELLAGYELREADGNRVLAGNLKNGTAVPVLTDPNIITLGSSIQVWPTGSSSPVALTPLLDANGNPLIDSGSHPLFIQTSDPLRKIVEFVNGGIQPYVNPDGEPENVATPKDTSGNPFQDSQGNPILVLGRNIDTSGSGVIGQNIVEKATGSIRGLILGAHNIVLDSIGPQIVYALGRHIDSTGPVDPTSRLIGPDVTAPTADPSSLLTPATMAPGTTANATSQAASNSGANQTTALTDQSNDDDDKKKKKEVALAQKVSRVTVILPAKSSPPDSSQKQTSTQPL